MIRRLRLLMSLVLHLAGAVAFVEGPAYVADELRSH